MQSVKCQIMVRYNSEITALYSDKCGCSVHFTAVCVGGCVYAVVCAQGTYGPQSTRRERTLSIPMSHTFMHSALISIQRPWKFSWSYTHIWGGWGKENKVGVRNQVTEVVWKPRATLEKSKYRTGWENCSRGKTAQERESALLSLWMCMSDVRVTFVCLLYLVRHHAHLRHLVLSCLPISLGSRLGLLSSSRHDDWEEKQSH